MRKILLMSASLLMCLVLHAESITKETARRAAVAFLQQRGIATVSETNVKMAFKAPRKSLSVTSPEAASYYIFDVGNNRGFVVVSGDDRTESILGYTDNGAYHPDSLPENMAAWLAGYVDEIKQLDETTDTTLLQSLALRKTLSVTETAKTPISPLLRSKWNQFAPYNLNTPLYNGTSRSATGCVATAMAQVINYYRYPSATTATIPAYTTSTYKVAVDSIPAGAAIDWNNMLDAYSSYTEAQGAAVAALMKYCGVSVTMDYGPSSGANTAKVATALKTYFGYDSDVKYQSRGNYTATSWFNLIYNELAAGRPVLYAGQSSGGGHAFVCDGYDAEGLFHINWGWGGMANGYFRLSVMNPGTSTGAGASASSDGYAMSQEVIVGICLPDGVSPSAEGQKLTGSSLSVSADGTGTSIRMSNQTGAAGTFNYGVGLLTESGITPLKTGTVTLGANYFFTSTLYPLPSLTQPGTYKVVPISKLTSASAWQVSTNPELNYFEVVVAADGTKTLTVHNKTAALAATAFRAAGTSIAGTAQEVQVTLENSGEAEYNGALYLFASTTETMGTSVNHTGTVVAPGKTETLSFYFTPSAGGTYNLWVATNSAGTNVIGQGTLTFENAATGTPTLTTGSFNIDNNTNNTVYGKSIKGSITITNSGTETFAGTVRIYLMGNVAGTGTYTGSNSVAVTKRLGAGESGVYEFEFEDVDYNKYILGAYINGYSTLIRQSSVFTVQAGFTYWTADGESHSTAVPSTVTVPDNAVAVNLEGATGITSVTPNSNPNTLYYFAATDVVPTSLSGKNVIQGGTAASVTLEDGYDFYAPADFEATAISYRRTVGQGTGGTGGWETIVLPFAVESVAKADGTAIDWIKEKGGAGQFWLKAFAGIDDAKTVYFAYTDSFAANLPYIIAFPGDALGSQWSLAGQTLTFSAQNATVRSGQLLKSVTSAYRFLGTTQTQTAADAYTMNAAGTAFERTASTAVAPFRAWFQAVDGTLTTYSNRLLIGSYNGTTTGVETLSLTTTEGTVDVYDLNGRLIGRRAVVNGAVDTSHLPKGIYIINGKKICL